MWERFKDTRVNCDHYSLIETFKEPGADRTLVRIRDVNHSEVIVEEEEAFHLLRFIDGEVDRTRTRSSLVARLAHDLHERKSRIEELEADLAERDARIVHLQTNLDNLRAFTPSILPMNGGDE